jgi:hypothetical protein
MEGKRLIPFELATTGTKGWCLREESVILSVWHKSPRSHSRRSLPPGPSLSHGPEESTLFQLLLGSSTPTVFSGISPSYIGRSDLAMSRDSRHYPGNQTPKPRWSRVNLGEFLFAASNLYSLIPECRNADLSASCHLYSTRACGVPLCHISFGNSRLANPRLQSVYCRNPECRSPDALDSCHLYTLRSTVPIKSGDRTSRFRRAWDYYTRQPRFADM